MKKILPLMIFISSQLIFGCSRGIDYTEAEHISEQKLRNYAKSEHLAIEQFSKVEVSSYGKYPLIFDYESNSNPNHLIRICIEKSGVAHVHRMIEENSCP